MWTANRPPSRPTRTPSVHSVASVQSRPSSMTSPQLRRSGYESDQSSDTANEDEFIMQNANFPPPPSNTMPPMWQSARQQSGSAVSRLSQKFGTNVQVAEIHPPALRTQHRQQQEPAESSPDDDTRSRSSTLGGDEHDYEYPEKTPTSLPKKMQKVMEEDAASAPPPHIPGPLEQQLASLMSKLIFMERENPVVSVTPEEYKELSDRVQKLEDEKKTWQKRHEALYALRDEDVENNIKIRGMLAKARRELEGMTKLRDDDLVNLQVVRNKLADATRRLDSMQSQSGRSSPARRSLMLERRDTTDLFAVAKSAALEQRVLELERRNAALLTQVQGGSPSKALPNGTMPQSIDTLNSMTAHKAWKETVADLELRVKEKDAQIARLKAGGSPYVGTPKSGVERVHPAAMSSSAGGIGDWSKVEALHDEHAAYREKMGVKLQMLRGEKEGLQRELNRKEDECHALEVKVQSLQRRASVLI